MAQVKRETAIICMVDDLLKGSFVKTEGWAPSYFSTPLGDISRVNLIGVIISKDPSGRLIIDDGSGSILLRSFESETFSGLDIGNLVMVIGRPRIYNEEKYVLPEIIKTIDHKWGEHRQLQLKLLRKKIIPKKQEKRVVLNSGTGPQPVNYFQKILEFIKDLDVGEGADIGEVAKRSNVPDAETLIKKLIEEGEIFEIRPGKLKILE